MWKNRKFVKKTGMDGSVKISVIVTFFNASGLVGRCAASLFGQTLKEGIEYIFIDDGSDDGSAGQLQDVIRDYPERKECIKVLSNATKTGTSYSREKGLTEARGEFVIFCDADDWVELQMLAKMLRVAEVTEADVTCCGFMLEKPYKSVPVLFKSQKFPPLDEAPLDTLHFSGCNKLIRRSVIADNGLHFFQGIDRWEDMGLLSRIFACTQKIHIINKPYYHYRRVEGMSITTSRMERVLDDHLRMAEVLSAWFAEHFGNRHDRFVNYMKFCAKIKLMRGATRDAVRWKNTFPESNRHIMGYRNIPLHYRIAFLLAYMMPLPVLRIADRLFPAPKC